MAKSILLAVSLALSMLVSGCASGPAASVATVQAAAGLLKPPV